MRIAVLSDIHGNRHALRGGARRRTRRRRRRDLVPGRRRRLRRRPQRLRRARRRARCRLPGRQPRPRRHRRPLARRVLPRRGASPRAGRRRSCAPSTCEWLRGAAARQASARAVGLYHGCPRDPIWEYVLSALLAELCLDEPAPARLPRRPLATSRCRFVRPEGEPATGERRCGGDELDVADRRVAAEPRLRRPAARRRPAGRLARCSTSTRAPRRWRRTEYDVAGRAGRDPRRPPAGLAGRAPGVRSVSVRRRPVPRPR